MHRLNFIYFVFLFYHIFYAFICHQVPKLVCIWFPLHAHAINVVVWWITSTIIRTFAGIQLSYRHVHFVIFLNFFSVNHCDFCHPSKYSITTYDDFFKNLFNASQSWYKLSNLITSFFYKQQQDQWWKVDWFKLPNIWKTYIEAIKSNEKSWWNWTIWLWNN